MSLAGSRLVSEKVLKQHQGIRLQQLLLENVDWRERLALQSIKNLFTKEAADVTSFTIVSAADHFLQDGKEARNVLARVQQATARTIVHDQH